MAAVLPIAAQLNQVLGVLSASPLLNKQNADELLECQHAQ
jgi:hypothetical protein